LLRLAQVYYVQSAVGIMYHAGLYKRREHYRLLRRKIYRYAQIYLFSPRISLKMKIRSVAIVLNPELAHRLWGQLKNKYHITWWQLDK